MSLMSHIGFSDGRDLVAGVLDCEMLSLQGGLSD